MSITSNSLFIIILLSIDEDLNQLENAICVFAFGELSHGWLNQIEFLLQEVETNCLVDSTPVQQPIFKKYTFTQSTVNFLIVHHVEQSLEKNTVRKFGGELLDWRVSLLGKDPVYEFSGIFLVHVGWIFSSI